MTRTRHDLYPPALSRMQRCETCLKSRKTCPKAPQVPVCRAIQFQQGVSENANQQIF